jgi:hypothetical protein
MRPSDDVLCGDGQGRAVTSCAGSALPLTERQSDGLPNVVSDNAGDSDNRCKHCWFATIVRIFDSTPPALSPFEAEREKFFAFCAFLAVKKSVSIRG